MVPVFSGSNCLNIPVEEEKQAVTRERAAAETPLSRSPIRQPTHRKPQLSFLPSLPKSKDFHAQLHRRVSGLGDSSPVKGRLR